MRMPKSTTSKASFKINSTSKCRAKKMTFERAFRNTTVNYFGTNSEDSPNS